LPARDPTLYKRIMTDELPRYASMLAALGHESRLAILGLLARSHPRGLVVGEILDEVRIPASTLSHHLETLREQGLIDQRREGKFLRYDLAPAGVRELLGFLQERCGMGVVIAPAPAIPRRTPWGEF